MSEEKEVVGYVYVKAPTWDNVLTWMEQGILKFNKQNAEEFLRPATRYATAIQNAQREKEKFIIFHFDEDVMTVITSSELSDPENVSKQVVEAIKNGNN